MEKYNTRIKKIGITKSKIAERLGISNVLLSYYLNNTRPMPDHIAKNLENILDLYSKV